MPEALEDVHHFYDILACRSSRIDIGLVINQVKPDGTVLRGCFCLQPPLLVGVVYGNQLLVADQSVVNTALVAEREGEEKSQEQESCHLNIQL